MYSKHALLQTELNYATIHLNMLISMLKGLLYLFIFKQQNILIKYYSSCQCARTSKMRLNISTSFTYCFHLKLETYEIRRFLGSSQKRKGIEKSIVIFFLKNKSIKDA